MTDDPSAAAAPAEPVLSPRLLTFPRQEHVSRLTNLPVQVSSFVGHTSHVVELEHRREHLLHEASLLGRHTGRVDELLDDAVRRVVVQLISPGFGHVSSIPTSGSDVGLLISGPVAHSRDIGRYQQANV